MKRQYRATIACDVDGVVSDFEGEFCDRFGYDNRHLVSLEERYLNIDPELIKEFVNSPESYENLAPIFGGYLLLRQAKSLGFYVVLVTSRPKHLAEVTREWLLSYDAPYNELWYAKNKAECISYYNQLYPKSQIAMLVDDIPSNFHNLSNSVIGVVWEQEWNMNYTGVKARYNSDRMRLEINVDSVSKWLPFWGEE